MIPPGRPGPRSIVRSRREIRRSRCRPGAAGHPGGRPPFGTARRGGSGESCTRGDGPASPKPGEDSPYDSIQPASPQQPLRHQRFLSGTYNPVFFQFRRGRGGLRADQPAKGVPWVPWVLDRADHAGLRAEASTRVTVISSQGLASSASFSWSPGLETPRRASWRRRNCGGNPGPARRGSPHGPRHGPRPAQAEDQDPVHAFFAIRS